MKTLFVYLRSLSFWGLLHLVTYLNTIFVVAFGFFDIIIKFLAFVIFNISFFTFLYRDFNLIWSLLFLIVNIIIFALIDNTNFELEKIEYINFKKELKS